MAHRRKAGRKRKNGPRTPSGQPSRAHQADARDNGTTELQEKRRILVGETGDTDDSTTALGILCQHGCLDTADGDPDGGYERRNAGLRYAVLAAAVHGGRWPSNGTGREISEDEYLILKHDLALLERRLTYEQRQILDKTARSNYTPTWFHLARMGKPLTPVEETERHELLAALDAIRPRRNRVNANAA